MFQKIVHSPGIDNVRSDEDAFMREIWYLGYDCAVMDTVCQQLRLYKGDIEKVIDYRDYYDVMCHCRVIKGILPNGLIHQYLSDSDGSAQRFRDLIKLHVKPHFRIVEYSRVHSILKAANKQAREKLLGDWKDFKHPLYDDTVYLWVNDPDVTPKFKSLNNETD